MSESKAEHIRYKWKGLRKKYFGGKRIVWELFPCVYGAQAWMHVLESYYIARKKIIIEALCELILEKDNFFPLIDNYRDI